MKLYMITVLICTASIAAAANAEKSPRTIAQRGQFPILVSLRDVSGDEHFCSGAILNNHFILTTAECLVSNSGLKSPDSIYANLGIVRKYETGDRVNIKKIIHHESYNLSTKHNNIALLKTEKQIDTSYRLDSMDLSDVDSDIFIAVGWDQLQLQVSLQFSFSNF